MHTINYFLRLFLFAALLPFCSIAQQPAEKLVVKDAGDSLMLHAFRSAFDTNGNYYFESLLKGKGERFSLVTNKMKYPVVFWDRNIALVPYKSLVANAFYTDSTRRKIYYTNKYGTRVYGPAPGRIREVLEYGREHVAIELCVGSQSYLYLNDSLVNVTDSAQQQWLCAFSDNGNVMYSIHQQGRYKLFLNYKLIDSSAEAFTSIAINNNGYYTYAKQEHGKYAVHTPGKAFGPFGIVEHYDLWNNNAWYYTGCADSQCYMLINGQEYNNIPEAHSLIEDPATGNMIYHSDEEIIAEPFSPDHFLFAYNKDNDNGTFLNINGTVSRQNYEMVSVVSYDKNAGYAFYGHRTDTTGVERIYRNVNGKEKKLPPFRKARYRPHCLYIAPSGASLYYYQTRDSIYTFRNDTLLGKAVSAQKFLTWDGTALPMAHPEGLEYFQGINIDTVSYIMYNNLLSKPMPLINPRYDRVDAPAKGNIVAGDMNGNGFFIIQYIAPGKYLLNINNTVYKELEGMSHIFSAQSYLEERRLIFYGIKGAGFYQFTINY